MKQVVTESLKETIHPTTSPSDAMMETDKINGRRWARELKTMQLMVRCYCRAHHKDNTELCGSCQEMIDYATRRLERCPFKSDKPTCAKCPVHCYQSHWRQKMKEVMRYAGPRMLWRHPVLSLIHLWDGLRYRGS